MNKLSIPAGAAALAGLLLGACSPSDPIAAPPVRNAAAVPSPSLAAPPLAADDPCRLLAPSEVAAVLPQAQAGQRERSREKYGIRACVWAWSGGSFALQLWTGKAGVDKEIRSLTSGYTDPLSRSTVRYETIAGIGEAAMAVVEPADASRGILSDTAMLIAQRGDQVMELQSSGLANGDRAAALHKLATLGRAAAARL